MFSFTKLRTGATLVTAATLVIAVTMSPSTASAERGRPSFEIAVGTHVLTGQGEAGAAITVRPRAQPVRPEQRWQLLGEAGRTVQLRNVGSGLCLGTENLVTLAATERPCDGRDPKLLWRAAPGRSGVWTFRHAQTAGRLGLRTCGAVDGEPALLRLGGSQGPECTGWSIVMAAAAE